MSKMIFIRHAEPLRDQADPGIVAPIFNWPKNCPLKTIYAKMPRFCSGLKRSRETLECLTHDWDTPLTCIPALNEWDKETETQAAFMARVNYGIELLKPYVSASNHGILICGHARWMVAAHHILLGKITLGFDYLEGFVAHGD